EKWYLCFPIMGAITLVSGLWLLFTPIQREARQQSSGIGQTLSLLGDKTILLLFLGIFFAVGTDVSTNFISSKVMLSRFDYSKEMAGVAPQVYFVCRTIGAFIGMFAMTKMSELRYFRLNIVGCLAFALGLAFIQNDALDFVCIGGIGFCCSCVFPIIYGMALKNRPDKANEISGLMIMAVAGGTVSFLVGAANEQAGITGGALVIALEIVYLTYLAYFMKSK
ncbi:MAG: MFS transporter, partial [Prevotella sp.]|nr:MFS transporter [Prevotella sp.]